MAQRSERCNFRVDPERAARYRAAAERLDLEEASDFYRRACDDLADRVLGQKIPKSVAAHTADVAATKTKTARPLSKKEQASGRSNR